MKDLSEYQTEPNQMYALETNPDLDVVAPAVIKGDLAGAHNFSS